ncbi:hypothetical protein NLI96_g12772 [Meripilus lineatus]|uniref:Uncharacterized protein n=1 Tax=Meripilus lineatus TaxID=2056292 RepID=A0AAD5Y9K1_9APHY|nr:hypothetical protein NLI96_g12772 [Physisporinus lineatus]
MSILARVPPTGTIHEEDMQDPTDALKVPITGGEDPFEGLLSGMSINTDQPAGSPTHTTDPQPTPSLLDQAEDFLEEVFIRIAGPRAPSRRGHRGNNNNNREFNRNSHTNNGSALGLEGVPNPHTPISHSAAESTSRRRRGVRFADPYSRESRPSRKIGTSQWSSPPLPLPSSTSPEETNFLESPPSPTPIKTASSSSCRSRRRGSERGIGAGSHSPPITRRWKCVDLPDVDGDFQEQGQVPPPPAQREPEITTAQKYPGHSHQDFVNARVAALIGASTSTSTSASSSSISTPAPTLDTTSSDAAAPSDSPIRCRAGLGLKKPSFSHTFFDNRRASRIRAALPSNRPKPRPRSQHTSTRVCIISPTRTSLQSAFTPHQKDLHSFFHRLHATKFMRYASMWGKERSLEDGLVRRVLNMGGRRLRGVREDLAWRWDGDCVMGDGGVER